MKVEILVGQRQDRNLGEVDLLLAREREQQIERTFKTFDIDNQRRLVAGAFGDFGLELDDFGGHAMAARWGEADHGRKAAAGLADDRCVRAAF